MSSLLSCACWSILRFNFGPPGSETPLAVNFDLHRTFSFMVTGNNRPCFMCHGHLSAQWVIILTVMKYDTHRCPLFDLDPIVFFLKTMSVNVDTILWGQQRCLQLEDTNSYRIISKHYFWGIILTEMATNFVALKICVRQCVHATIVLSIGLI